MGDWIYFGRMTFVSLVSHWALDKERTLGGRERERKREEAKQKKMTFLVFWCYL